MMRALGELTAEPIQVVDWLCRIVAAAILVQTLFFKFTGAPESVYIFTKLGLEPWGRYVTGAAELVAAILLMFSRTAWLGALLAAGVMVGALAGHVNRLGIVVKDDGGLLFALAATVMICSIVTAMFHRRQIPLVGSLL